MTHPQEIPRRVRWAYELGRTRRALLNATPALVFLAAVLLEAPIRSGPGPPSSCTRRRWSRT